MIFLVAAVDSNDEMLKAEEVTPRTPSPFCTLKDFTFSGCRLHCHVCNYVLAETKP